MNRMAWIWMTIGMALLAVASYMAIVAWLRRRRERINFLLLGLRLPRYLNRYQELSRREKGQTGPLFYGFVACISLALAAFLVSLAG